MIVYDLQCRDGGERFEAWFGSGADFDQQLAGGLVECPFCRSGNVVKAPMAPHVPAKVSGGPLERLAGLQAEILRNSRWVGAEFAETARAMHLGELESAPVHGEASLAEAKSLLEDGIPVAPLPLPVVPPSQVN